MKKLLTEHQDNVVQRLREAVQAMEDGNTARVQELKQVAEKERQAWGLVGVGGRFRRDCSAYFPRQIHLGLW